MRTDGRKVCTTDRVFYIARLRSVHAIHYLDPIIFPVSFQLVEMLIHVTIFLEFEK